MPRRKAFIINRFITQLHNGQFHLCTLTRLNNFFCFIVLQVVDV